MSALSLTQVSLLHGQELQHFGINQVDSRSIGLGLTGIVDAYGPLSVLRNPALNRSGRTMRIKPLFQWNGNNKWRDVTSIPQQLVDNSNGFSSAMPTDLTGLTSRYYGIIVQGRGTTVGYIHSNRDELKFDDDFGLFDPQPKFYGRHMESDFLFAGYTLNVTGRGRIGVLLKNFRMSDTGTISTEAISLRNTNEVDNFLDDAPSDVETNIGIDLGGLFSMNVLGRPITVGLAVNNVVTDSLFGIKPPTFVNVGLALVPFNGLLLEANIVNKLKDDNNTSDSEFRFGAEYIFNGIRIRSGFAGENASFGVSLGSERFGFDYGVIEVDRESLTGEMVKETFQSFQINLSGRFF